MDINNNLVISKNTRNSRSNW